MKLKNNILLIMILIFAANIFSISFSSVDGNNLISIRYSFNQFLEDFGLFECFVCIDDNSWGYDVYEKPVFRIVEKIPDGIHKKVVLHRFYHEQNDVDEQQEIVINETNFPEFRNTFISRKPLKFDNDFPVKFLKVKTMSGLADIKFTFLPGDNEFNNSADTRAIFYTAYKHKQIGKDKYIFLVSKYTENLQWDRSDNLNYLCGWVLYESNSKKQNVVLWNTNIGLRPKFDYELGRKPYVFFKTSDYAFKEYWASGFEPDPKNLIVDDRALDNYKRRITNKQGGVLRWLPIYNSNAISYRHSCYIGVVDSTGYIRNDAINFIFMEEIALVFLVDATGSMTKVWRNLDDIILKIIQNILSSDLHNAQGDKIEPKIKVYYYSSQCHAINSEKWIKNFDDLEQYRSDIENIIPLTNPTFHPYIYQSLETVFKDVGEIPMFVTVIGDAGDHEYTIPFESISELKDKYERTYTPINGISFYSQADHPSYKEGLDRFERNFQIIEKIEDINFRPTEIDNVAQKLSESLVSELQKTIDAGKNILIYGNEIKTEDETTMSTFSKAYIDYYREELKDIGAGTYFDEGLVAFQDQDGNSVYHIDILIKKSIVEQILPTIKAFIDRKSSDNIESMIRSLLAAFYEIDKSEIDDEFLKNTTLKDFWDTIVGERQMAIKIIPDFYNNNITMYEIVSNYDAIYLQLFQNCQIRHDSLNEITNSVEHRQKILVDPFMNNTETYYWVNSDILNIFEDIDLESLKN